MYFHKDWKPTWPSIRLNFGLHTHGFSLHHLWCLLSWIEHFPHRFHDYSVVNIVVPDIFLHINGFPCSLYLAGPHGCQLGPIYTHYTSRQSALHHYTGHYEIAAIDTMKSMSHNRRKSNYIGWHLWWERAVDIKHTIEMKNRWFCQMRNDKNLFQNPALLLGLKHWPL